MKTPRILKIINEEIHRRAKLQERFIEKYTGIGTVKASFLFVPVWQEDAERRRDGRKRIETDYWMDLER